MGTNKDSNGIWTVVIIAAIAGAGWWYYDNYLKDKVNTVSTIASYL